MNFSDPDQVPTSLGERKLYLGEISKLAYNYGFYPIPLNNKFPLAKGWTSFRNDYSEDAKDISQGKNPKSVRRCVDLFKTLKGSSIPNLGVVTGEASQIVVIDIDTEKDGVNIWKNFVLANNLNSELDKTFTVETPSGGYHYYFKYTPELSKLGNINRIYRLPFDYRTNGGMIVFPGSINKEGKPYRALNGYKLNLGTQKWEPNIIEMPVALKKLLVMDRIVKSYRPNVSVNITDEILAAKASELGISF